MIIIVLVLAIALLVAAGLLILTDRARRHAQEQVRQAREERRRTRPARRPPAAEPAVAPGGGPPMPSEPVPADPPTVVTPAVTDAPPAAEPSAAEPPVAEPPVAAEAAAAEPAAAEAAAAQHLRSDVVDPADRGRLGALWELTVLATAWEHRRAGDLSTAPATVDGDHDLGSVLASEVERIRDEGGIPGTSRVALDPPSTPGQAMVVLRAVQLLLACLARHCDGYDVFVHRWEGRISAIVVCEGFSGPDSVADETTEILVAMRPAGGDIDVDRDPDGRLRARLTIPE